MLSKSQVPSDRRVFIRNQIAFFLILKMLLLHAFLIFSLLMRLFSLRSSTARLKIKHLFALVFLSFASLSRVGTLFLSSRQIRVVARLVTHMLTLVKLHSLVCSSHVVCTCSNSEILRMLVSVEPVDVGRVFPHQSFQLR
jgi:hypothetical protein